MKRIHAASRTDSPRRTQASLPSALLFLGGQFLILEQACAQAATGAATAGSALPSSTGSIFTALFGLAAVLALMAAIAWLFKRFGLTRSLTGNAAAKIIGGVSVGTRERVMVIEVGDQWVVVGVAPGRVNALTTMPRQEIPAHQEANSGTPAFASWLKQTMDKRNGGPVSQDRPGNDGNTT